MIVFDIIYVSFKMQKASLSLEANPLEIHVHDFFTIEVRQSPNVSDGATTPNEELPTEKTPVQPIYPVSDDSCTDCWWLMWSEIKFCQADQKVLQENFVFAVTVKVHCLFYHFIPWLDTLRLVSGQTGESIHCRFHRFIQNKQVSNQMAKHLLQIF